MTLLKLEGLSKSYGAFRALSCISAEIGQGEIFSIIGPNGAGKTTLFRVMTGEVLPSAGRISLRDEDISHLTADERVRRGMGRTFQVARVFPEYTAFQNVVVAIEARQRMRGERLPFYAIRPKSQIADEAAHRLAELGLGSALRPESRELSLGDRKRLELALTLALEPDVLMLDEPTAGMSPGDRHGIVALISQVRTTHGVTIVLTEHDIDFVFRLSDRILVMNQGQHVATGLPADIRADEGVKEIYLGKESQHA